MTRSLFAAAAVAGLAALAACSKPSAAKCSQNADCPPNAICVSGICQKGVPSGSAAGTVAGAGHLSSGTLTLDAVAGQPMPPAASSGTTTVKPAENTR